MSDWIKYDAVTAWALFWAGLGLGFMLGGILL
jgi:hypothetical protein